MIKLFSVAFLSAVCAVGLTLVVVRMTAPPSSAEAAVADAPMNPASVALAPPAPLPGPAAKAAPTAALADESSGYEAQPATQQDDAAGLTRDEYKRHKASGDEPRYMAVNTRTKSDSEWTKTMAPKLSSFFSQHYDNVTVKKVECQRDSCVIKFHTSERDGVVGMVEQAQKDLGASGGGALGGRRVRGKRGLYKYEALLTFDRP